MDYMYYNFYITQLWNLCGFHNAYWSNCYWNWWNFFCFMGNYYYTFQPILEERFSYILSTIITFLAWGVWHFSYFYIEGTLSQVQIADFALGLLVNCFILSALYAKTNSLWLCVMTHSLINVFSQITTGGNQYVLFICRIIIIIIAVACANQKRTHFFPFFGRFSTPLTDCLSLLTVLFMLIIDSIISQSLYHISL